MATILLVGLLNLHAYYISFCEMEYNPDSKNAEVSIKLTAHDLDKELEDIYKVDIRLDKQSDSLAKVIENYLQETVKLYQGKKSLNLVLDGYEYDLSGDLYLFFHFQKFVKSKPFELKNNLLFLNFPQQQNIVSFKLGEKKYEKTLTVKENSLTSKDF